MNEEQRDQLEVIIASYTFEQQMDVFMEECAEAIQAVLKLRRAERHNTAISVEEAEKHLKEEVADVLVMAEQMKSYLGTKEVDRIVSEKLARQIRRIRKGE